MARKSGSLDTLVADMQSEFGTESVMFANNIPKRDIVPTGSLAVDYAIGIGGIPRGCVIEVAGAEGCGKTTLVLHMVHEYLKKYPDLAVVYVDAEHRLDSNWVANFVEDRDRLIVVKPDHFEQATNMLIKACKSKLVSALVMDSIGGTPSMAVANKDAEKGNFGGNSGAVTRFSQLAMTMGGKYKVTTIGINQVREDMAGYQRHMTPGGRAWKHACTLRFRLKKGKGKYFEKQPDGDELQVGYTVVLQVVKNSVSAPGRSVYYWFYNLPSKKGFGIDKQEEINRLAILTGVIEKSGSMYRHPDFPGGKIRGADSAKAYVAGNPELQDKIVAQTIEKLQAGNTKGIVKSFDLDDDDAEGMDISAADLELTEDDDEEEDQAA
ncbi:hypothetical protein [Streptomyces sp. CoH17]|uniref:hypothetical protein n=1 Tax=Streptomyces sp. CoH17 TaxID=2992806 RepID=UPI00226F4A8F|nr:hypothetical protein [Streptomyces sp. CoH17]